MLFRSFKSPGITFASYQENRIYEKVISYYDIQPLITCGTIM